MWTALRLMYVSIIIFLYKQIVRQANYKQPETSCASMGLILHTISGCGKVRRILIDLSWPAKATLI